AKGHILGTRAGIHNAFAVANLATFVLTPAPERAVLLQGHEMGNHAADIGPIVVGSYLAGRAELGSGAGGPWAPVAPLPARAVIFQTVNGAARHREGAPMRTGIESLRDLHHVWSARGRGHAAHAGIAAPDPHGTVRRKKSSLTIVGDDQLRSRGAARK